MKLFKSLFQNKVKKDIPYNIGCGMRREFIIPDINKSIGFGDTSIFQASVINSSILRGGERDV